MQPKASYTLVKIRETDCIGCTKCIQACPVDAILGAHQFMHTVIAEECIGCQLCIEPCPVDCIDIIPLPIPREKKPAHVKKRYRVRQERLAKQAAMSLPPSQSIEDKKAYLQAALLRAKK